MSQDDDKADILGIILFIGGLSLIVAIFWWAIAELTYW